MVPRTRIHDRATIHVEAREETEPNAFSMVWRRPGWETDFVENRGSDWDRSPEARLVSTTGLIEAVSGLRLRAVLAHELAHIEAGDHLGEQWKTGASSRRRERSADLRAIDICGNGAAVAGALLYIFRELAPESRSHIGTHGRATTRANAVAARLTRDLGL